MLRPPEVLQKVLTARGESPPGWPVGGTSTLPVGETCPYSFEDVPHTSFGGLYMLTIVPPPSDMRNTWPGD